MSSPKFFCRVSALAVALLMGAGTLCAVMSGNAFAAEEPYAYTVRIYAGAQGSFEGKDYLEVTVDPTSENTRVSFSQSSVTLEDGGKYYVRGIKEAGRDNSDTLAAASFEVTEDADYVVAYGILGDNVAYTVRYVDAQGNELFPSEQFYGNVGDSPVLAYRYVEGYQPQAYNLTGQLLADASQNVYTFVYQPVAAPQQPQQPDEPQAPEAPEAPAATPGAPAAPAATAPGGEEGLTVEPPAQATAVIDDDQTPQAAPAEVQDIRDDETPLASAGGSEAAPGSEAAIHGAISDTALVAVAAFAGAAVLLLLLLLLLRRRKEEEQPPATSAQSFEVNDESQR